MDNRTPISGSTIHRNYLYTINPFGFAFTVQSEFVCSHPEWVLAADVGLEPTHRFLNVSLAN